MGLNFHHLEIFLRNFLLYDKGTLSTAPSCRGVAVVLGHSLLLPVERTLPCLPISVRRLMGSTTTSVNIVVSTTTTMCPGRESLRKSNGSRVLLKTLRELSPPDEGTWCRSRAFQVGPIFPDFLGQSMRYVLENCQMSRLCSSQDARSSLNFSPPPPS